jgi:hypothetical protein
VEVPDLQGTDSGPRAHLGRGSEPPGRAIILSSRPTILNFYLSSRSDSRELQSGEARADVFPELLVVVDLSGSLARAHIFLLKKRRARSMRYSGPLGGVVRGLRMPTT